MVWTDMTAVDEAGKVLHDRYLRKFYGAHKKVAVEEIMARSGSLSELWPDAPAELAKLPFYNGDIASYMILGNLVHTSTVLLRRDRLAQVGGFDESLRISGEDYEFHLRTCFQGPVGFLDVPSILYRIGAEDQLTAPRFLVHGARNNLITLLRWLERGRARITLPEGVIRRQLASAFRWLGEEELLVGDTGSARGHLWQSLRLQPGHIRTAKHLVKSLLPQSLVGAARWFRRLLRSEGRAQDHGVAGNRTACSFPAEWFRGRGLPGPRR
jgi:hypothetical protein